MNLRSMGVFCKVVEKGVMAHAAEELNMTPAAVSKLISELENSLGVRLLNRTTRKLKLTEVGVKYYESCINILSQIEDIHNQFSGLSVETKGDLRIAAPVSYGLTALPGIIDGFQDLYPQVSITIHLQDAIVDLVENGYDVAIRIQREMKDSSLIAKAFGVFEHYIICSKSYYKKHGPITTPEELKDHKCIAYTNSKNPNRWTLTSKNHQYIHKFSPSIEVNNSILIKEFALKGNGICLLPAFLIESDLEAGKVQQVLPDYELQKAKGWLVYPSRKFQRPIVTKFLEYFLNKTNG